jgi:hypothetical protein
LTKTERYEFTYLEAKEMRNRIFAIICLAVGFVFMGAMTASAGTVATIGGIGSLFQFIGNGVMAENTSNTILYLKCVTEINDGWIFPLAGKSSLDDIYPLTKGNILCVVVNANNNWALANNYVKVMGYNEGVEVPVLTYVANAKKGTRMGVAQKSVLKLFMDGQAGHYAAPPQWLYIGIVPTYVAGTVNQDLTDNRKPFLTRIHEYYPVWRANRYPTCMTDFDDFLVPYYNYQQFWIKGIRNSTECGGQALDTSLHGYGIDQNGNVVWPTCGSAAGSGWVKTQRSTFTAESVASLSAGIPIRICPK